jgi:GINS complex subunit 1
MNYGQYGRDLLRELKRSSGAAGNTNNAASEPALTAYNDETVRNCLEDLKLHVQALQDQVQANSGTVAPSSARRGGGGNSQSQQSQSPGAASSTANTSTKPSFAVRPSILLQTAAIQRNKRCLLTYHVARLERIKEHFYWKSQDPEEQNKANAMNSEKANNADTGDTTTTNTSGGSTRKILCPAEEEWLVQYGALVDRYTGTTGLPPGTLVAHSMAPPVSSDRVLVRVVNEAKEFADGAAICLESGATACLVLGSTHFLLLSDMEEYLRAGYLQLLDGEEEGQ